MEEFESNKKQNQVSELEKWVLELIQRSVYQNFILVLVYALSGFRYYSYSRSLIFDPREFCQMRKYF